MNTSSITGRRGEDIAVRYLRDNGFLIRDRNWRSGRYETDIVAEKSGVVHIVEVKTRRAGALAPPESAVTPSKRTAMRRAAEAYMAQRVVRGEAALDLLAVDMFPDGSYDVRYIPNAVEIGW